MGIPTPEATKKPGNPRGRRRNAGGSATHATALGDQRKKRKLFSEKLRVSRKSQHAASRDSKDTPVQCVLCAKTTTLENITRSICGFLTRRVGADILCVRLILVWRELQRKLEAGEDLQCEACRGYTDDDAKAYSLHVEVNRAAHMQQLRTELLGLTSDEQQLPTSLTRE
jgi:hypothetical protein